MCIHLGKISDTVRMDGRMDEGKDVYEYPIHNNKAIWEFINVSRVHKHKKTSRSPLHMIITVEMLVCIHSTPIKIACIQVSLNASTHK